MPILNCHPIARLSSSFSALPPNNNNNSSSSSSSSPSLNPQPSKPNYKKLKQPPPRPSVFEIERAIGAGIFRDKDVNREVEEKASSSLMDNILKNTVGKNEGPVEKKLRESGEWLIHQSDTLSRSAGKQILTIMFVWMIPLWMSAFLVASRILHLPFLDDFFS